MNKLKVIGLEYLERFNVCCVIEPSRGVYFYDIILYIMIETGISKKAPQPTLKKDCQTYDNFLFLS